MSPAATCRVSDKKTLFASSSTAAGERRARETRSSRFRCSRRATPDERSRKNASSSARVNSLARPGHRNEKRRLHHRPHLVAVVDDDGSFPEQYAWTGHELRDAGAVFVHVIGAVAWPSWHDSAGSSLHVVGLRELSLAVVRPDDHAGDALQ